MADKNLLEMPVSGKDGIFPYAVTGLNMLAATLSAQSLLTSRTTVIAITLILLGLPLSFYFSRRNYNRMLLNVLIMVPLIIITGLLVRGLPGLAIDWSNPWESFLAQETTDNLIVILHILVIIAAGRAFTLVTRRDLIQTAIPSVSIFIMSAVIPATGTDTDTHHDPFTLLYLLTVSISSLYLLTQGHNQLWFSSVIPNRIQRQLITWVLIISLTAFPLVVVTGARLDKFNIISLARYHVTHPLLKIRLPFVKGRAGIGFSNTIDMRDNDWPNGNQVLMRVLVKRGQNLLYRSTTYDKYTDGQWVKSDFNRQKILLPVPRALTDEGYLITLDPASSQSDPGIAEGILEKKISLDQNEGNGSLSKQIYTIVAPGFGSDFPIYGAFQIHSISIPYSSIPYLSLGNDGAVSFTENLQSSPWLDRYEVNSIIKPLPRLLRLNKTLKLPHAAETAYLQIPDNLGWQFREKAVAILKDNNLSPDSNKERIIYAFESYLRKNCQYTLKPSPPKNGEDPILDFLLTQKKGYCTFFSGAMVMLCRSVKIPARVVTGFSSGEERSPAVHSDVTLFEVAEKDAHSWVEVFLPNYGWYTSDPTAGSVEALSFSGKILDGLYELGRSIRSNVSQFITVIKHSAFSKSNPFPLIIFIFFLIVGLFFLRRERPQAFPQHELTNAEAAEQVLHAYKQMHSWLRRRGIKKPDSSTAIEFLHFFHQLSPAMKETVGELSNLYIKARYGVEMIDDLEARHSIVLLHQLWAELHHKENHKKAA